MADDRRAKTWELIAAMQAPGLLRDQPAVRALLAATPAKRPKLTLLQGGGAR